MENLLTPSAPSGSSQRTWTRSTCCLMRSDDGKSSWKRWICAGKGERSFLPFPSHWQRVFSGFVEVTSCHATSQWRTSNYLNYIYKRIFVEWGAFFTSQPRCRWTEGLSWILNWIWDGGTIEIARGCNGRFDMISVRQIFAAYLWIGRISIEHCSFGKRHFNNSSYCYVSLIGPSWWHFPTLCSPLQLRCPLVL